ncbi:MAG TPA: YuiB family protein [Bacillales bacterium]|nr:YuiB family protein [Bacillales bacterium]
MPVQMNPAQIIISIILFMILFFGIGFIANMLLRSSWVPAVIYPLIVILIVDRVHFYEYVTNFQNAITDLIHQFTVLQPVDIAVLSSGFLGAIIAGVIIRLLRSKGYQMF